MTIGATAPFNSLLEAVLAQEFLQMLQQAGYTELRIQYGDHQGENIFTSRTKVLKASSENGGLEITGFGFNKDGLTEEMIAVKGQSKSHEGMVISHGGQLDVLMPFISIYYLNESYSLTSQSRVGLDSRCSPSRRASRRCAKYRPST